MDNQFKMKVFSLLLAFVSIGIFGVSCSENDEDSSIDVETIQNYVDQSIYSLHTEGNIGKMGCFEFIFPVSIEFPDGSITEVDDYDVLRSELKEWIQANRELIQDERDEDRDNEEREGGKFRHGYFADVDWELLPSLVFPIEVIAEDGTVTSIEDRGQLFELKKSCAKKFYGEKGRHGHGIGDRCFSLVFPITLVFEDGSTITGEDRRDLKTQLRAWKETAEEGAEKPSLQFPITIELEDGTTQEVSDQEAFMEVKDNCNNSN